VGIVRWHAGSRDYNSRDRQPVSEGTFYNCERHQRGFAELLGTRLHILGPETEDKRRMGWRIVNDKRNGATDTSS